MWYLDTNIHKLILKKNLIKKLYIGIWGILRAGSCAIDFTQLGQQKCFGTK